ncbi:hypothetical protein [Plantactinospora sp. KLBMP9567]|nr:hypothetical protein [Plantactinospora sp. KLBMP9567]MDW5328040.1 hypothetical protein [Plantactinospora sp. KLBMP9567]
MAATSTDEPGRDAPDPDPGSELAELTRGLADLRAKLAGWAGFNHFGR